MQSQLPKFVQINWCGDGVPEAKKGLFHTHSPAVARFLRGTHVVINARNEVRCLDHQFLLFTWPDLCLQCSVRRHPKAHHVPCRIRIRREILLPERTAAQV